MAKGPPVIFDLDCVVFDTIKTINLLYSIDYFKHPKFKQVDPKDIVSWDFVELECATREQIDAYFNDPRFFLAVQEFAGAKTAINKLQKNHDIIFCSAGYGPNLKMKEEYLRKNYPGCKFIGVDILTYPDKSHVDMRGAWFIDDSSRNLRTSNAARKILFGRTYSWNEDWDGEIAENWVELYKMIK